MKKILATILALVMVFSLSVTVLAADPNTINSVTANNVSTGTVEVTVTEGVNDKIVYSVTVGWDDTEMEYQTEGEGTWDPTTHTYEDATEAGWKDSTAQVTVTNHSNAAVTATIAEGTKATTGITYSFNKTSFELATAVGTAVAEAPKDTFTITASGTPTEGDDTFIVTIAAYAEPVTFTIDDDEYTVPGNTTWASFAASNSDAYTQRGNYIDSSKKNQHLNTFVSKEDAFVTAASVIEAGAYTLNYALMIDDTAYTVSDKMVSDSSRMSTFIEGKSEFSLSDYTSDSEGFNTPIIYTNEGVEYYLAWRTEPVVPMGYVTNYLSAGDKLVLKAVDTHYLLEIAYNTMLIVSNDVETWSDLAEVDSRFTVDGNGVLYNSSCPVITLNEEAVTPDDTIVKNSAYRIDF